MNTTPRPPITCDEFDALVPDLIEHTLDDGTRALAEAHTSGCARCTGLLADLTDIRTDAAQLPVLKPTHDLWNAISARIETPAIAYTVGVAQRQRAARARMMAAAVLLIAVTATATWKVAQRMNAPAAPDTTAQFATQPSVPDTPNADPVSFRLASAYDAEITKLRRQLEERPGGLDSATARVVAANFRVIDDAIGRVRIALDSAPANALLSQQLARAYETKLNTLRQIAALQTD